MEKKVLSTEELNKIKEIREQFTDITSTLGNLEMQIMNLELEKETIKDSLKILRDQETTLAEDLKNKYGDGNISLETGEFTPLEAEQNT